MTTQTETIAAQYASNICQSCGKTSLHWFCPDCNDECIDEFPISTQYRTPVACPFCPDTHAPGKCPVAAALTGTPLIEGLRREIAELRAELATAHEVVGGLVAAIDELDSIGEWIWSEADDKTLLSIYLTESHHTELTDLMLAARTWLRREA